MNPLISFLGGIITVVSTELVEYFQKYLPKNSVISEFLLCLFAMNFSFVIGYLLSTHPSHLFIGSLAIALPGLVLTSAIFELLDQLYLTGIVKLSKSFLILLTLGFSYVLTAELFSSLDFMRSTVAVESSMNILQFVSRFISTAVMVGGFAILLQVPRKSIFECVWIGLSGWTFFSILSTKGHIYLGAFAGAGVIAFLSQLMSSRKMRSTQIYLVPGLLMLVPGLLAFSYIQPLLDKGLSGVAIQSVLSSIMIACALSFGIFLGLHDYRRKVE